MSSGSKGNRSVKGTRGGSERNPVSDATHTSNSNNSNSKNLKQTKSDLNHTDKGRDVSVQKIAPTAEQLRIAQMIDNPHPDKGLQEKINQVMQVTGVTQDDAVIALYDCDNDVTSAIDCLLEGEDQGEWRESTKKKKKAPVPKSKEDCDSNKENRRVENKERSGTRTRGSGGPPRFRGRGGRPNREDSDGFGRGSRRGRISNGSLPFSRGRGSRGRGSAANTRTFQSRQPPGFTETIDTWECTPDKTIQENNLQIDNWDEEPSGAGSTEDWDSEWTGSLDQTTVFGASATVPSANPRSEVLEKPENLMPVSNLSNNLDLTGSLPPGSLLGSGGHGTSPMHGSGGGGSINSTVANLPATLPDAGSNLLSSLNRSALSAPQTQQYSSSVSASPSSISQSQSIDIATLLQKAAPCSSLGRLPPSSQMPSGASLGNPSSLSSGGQVNILGSMASNVADSMKSNIYVSNGGPPTMTPATGQPYSSTTPSINDSIFSNSGLPSSVAGNLGTSLSNNSSVKVIGLSSPTNNMSSNSSLVSRTKPQRTRLGQSSSKIPSSAVEMPEDAMAALDVQFSGLEFGAETFDFSSEVKTLVGSNLVSGSSINARDPSSVSKDIGQLNSTLSQPPSLGPEPIPFPSQGSERKSQPSSMLSGPTQRSSAGAHTASSAAPPQGLADLTKKDASSVGGGPLGSLVGSSSSAPSYQSSVSSSGHYGSSKSSFPSPPSAHFAQSPSQSYSTTTSSGVGSSNYPGGSSTVVNSTENSSNSQSTSGYGSSFSVQGSASSGSVQYQNSYVNTSSHSSLASISVPKTHTGLKESSQSYNDSVQSSSSLAGSLPTNVSGGGANSGSSGLSSLTSASNSAQPPKSTVPGKSVNSMGPSVPPGVQHSVNAPQQQQMVQPHHLSQQQQQHPSHHHQLQQQVAQQAQQQTQQTPQLMAPGPSQYVSPTAALQGALPTAFYNVQQPAMYSFEDLQMFQRIPHLQQAPTSLPGGRDGGPITSLASYSVTDASKFRTDQNSSPVPSTINQQAATAGGTYITAAGNAAIPPFYMHYNIPAVPSSFPQYGHPAIIQIPPNTHTGSTSTQFPGPPKLPYPGTSTYYDNLSQGQDYKPGYGSGSQGQTKTGASSTGSASNSGSDLSGYKNHLGKVSRTYDKQGFHTGTPPPFNLPGSGTNPMTANAYGPPMFIQTMPAAAQHHSPLMHHQLHQDGGNSASQRAAAAAAAAAAGVQSKGSAKGGYSGSYWSSN